MKTTDACDLLARVVNVPSVDRLLGLENSIDAFGRNDDLAFVLENKRRILAIKHDYVDLLAELTIAINNVRGIRLVALR